MGRGFPPPPPRPAEPNPLSKGIAVDSQNREDNRTYVRDIGYVLLFFAALFVASQLIGSL